MQKLLGSPQLIFNFTAALHANFILFWAKGENIWIHADSCISSTQLLVHLYLRTECHADLYMTVFVFLTELMESTKASKCISVVLFIKRWFHFPIHRPERLWGRRKGGRGRRRDVKTDINRSHAKQKGLTQSKEKCGEQKERSYCKHFEPLVPLSCSCGRAG